MAVKEADVIVFMVDVTAGLTADDRQLAAAIRKKV